MEPIVDVFNFPAEMLSEEFGLYKPNLEHSVAGIFPSLLKHLNLDSMPDLDQFGFAPNSLVDKKLEESFPSGYDNIIFLVCDAVGVERLQELGGTIWDNIQTQGTIASSMFPTMTSTVMTSLSFGKTPSEHGLIGYNTYNEKIDSIWNSLNLQYKDAENQDKNLFDNFSIEDFVEGKPAIDAINDKGANLQMNFIAPDQLGSPSLLDLINRSVPILPYANPMDAGMKLANTLNQEIKNQVIAVYIGYPDYFGHYNGPESIEYAQAIQGIDQSIQMLMNHPKIKDGSTVIVMTSDHGQVQIDHKISYWATRREIAEYKKQGLTFSTSGRAIHLYADESNLEKGYSKLEEFANGKGLIIDKTTYQEFTGGFDKYINRMPDYTMIMEDRYLYDIPEVVQFGSDDRLFGQHGSLTDKELFVPVGIFGGNA